MQWLASKLSEVLQEDTDSESKVMAALSSQPFPEKSLESLSATELISTLQKVKAEEQKLANQISEFFSKEKDLRKKIMAEIIKRQKAIQDLKSQIQTMQNGCYNLTQALCAELPETGESST